MKRHERLLDLAIIAARDSTAEICRFRLAAIVAHKNRVIAIGYNRRKTHTIANTFRRRDGAMAIHAEVDALAKASAQIGDLSGCDLYVARVLVDQTVAMAKPCEGCQRAVAAFNIRRVYYTVDSNNCGLL
jgi:deoxycytidylate deaminase